MSDELYASLRWLPRPPGDFRARCRQLNESQDEGCRALSRLAACAMDENQLRHLAKAIEARRTGGSLEPLTPFKLAVLGNATLEPLLPGLVASAVRHGIALQCITADYAQTVQEALSPNSEINQARPDAVLLALDYRGLPLMAGPSGNASDSIVAGAIEFLQTLRSGFRAHGGAFCILQSLATPPETIFGSFERLVPNTLRSLIAEFNAAVVNCTRDSDDVILDVASLAETVGSANWFSPTHWNIAKLPFDAKFLPLYADHVARLIGALRGKSRRCLILDLDNTVWGGEIGDYGIEGIVIGQGDATGEAYLEVQRLAIGLWERGVVLAVSSKNDHDTARAAFRENPDMVLREDHFAIFQANWNDKATNITAIATELSLGLDAMVFLDDNPVERGLVREMLPEVAVPELPEDPGLYARTLAAAGYFESVAFSEDDKKRTDFYKGNARRVALKEQVGDVRGYLASLQMRIVFRPFDTTGRSRIAQLINKSNQFNLTTRRYTELDVANFESDPNCFTLQVRLLDVFGDNGMISVVICRGQGDSTWQIDAWLMSCRVLGRGVEQAVLSEIVHHARLHGVEALTGLYVPTARNALVRDHYEKLGFAPVASDASGATTWKLDTGASIETVAMVVERTGFKLPYMRAAET